MFGFQQILVVAARRTELQFCSKLVAEIYKLVIFKGVVCLNGVLRPGMTQPTCGESANRIGHGECGSHRYGRESGMHVHDMKYLKGVQEEMIDKILSH